MDEGLDDWNALYQVNFLHVLLVTHAFLPIMVEKGGAPSSTCPL